MKTKLPKWDYFKAVALAAAGVALAVLQAQAQETNVLLLAPQTKLEGFSTNTDTIILQATAQIGAVSANSGALTVRSRVISEVGSNHREFGLAIAMSAGNYSENLLVDYDELNGLVNALDYLAKVDWTITTLQSFDASFTTKAGFRLAAHGSRQTGAIEFTARNIRWIRSGYPVITLSRDQLAQLRSLVDQARAKLDSLR